MRASEVMIRDPVVAAAGATSAEVATLMRMKDISVVPVVDPMSGRRSWWWTKTGGWWGSYRIPKT